jgi:hypothetical protein
MDEPLPPDLDSCHATIRQLRQQLAQTRKLLIGVMGYDPTDTQAVFGYQQAMSDAMKRVASKPKARKKI